MRAPRDNKCVNLNFSARRDKSELLEGRGRGGEFIGGDFQRRGEQSWAAVGAWKEGLVGD